MCGKQEVHVKAAKGNVLLLACIREYIAFWPKKKGEKLVKVNNLEENKYIFWNSEM